MGYAKWWRHLGKKLHVPPEPLSLKLVMQKILLAQAKNVEDRKEWRLCIKKTQADIKRHGLFRKIKNATH